MKLRGIAAPLDRHASYGLAHVGVGEAVDPVGRLQPRHPQRSGHLDIHRSLGGGPVESPATPGDRMGVEVAENQVGVGHRHLRPAGAVADGAGYGACALRTHVRRPSPVDPEDAAATCSHFGDVEGRDPDREPSPLDEQATLVHPATDLVLGSFEGLAVLDQGSLGGGAAHVERDHVGFPEPGGEGPGGDHARGGTRLDQPHRLGPCGPGSEQGPVRLHDLDLAVEADG